MGYLTDEEKKVLYLKEFRAQKMSFTPKVISGADIKLVDIKTKAIMEVKGFEYTVLIPLANLTYILNLNGMHKDGYFVGDYVFVRNRLQQVYMIPTNDDDYRELLKNKDKEGVTLERGKVYNIHFSNDSIYTFDGKPLEESVEINVGTRNIINNVVYCGLLYVGVEIENDPQLGKNIVWYENKEVGIYTFYIPNFDLYIYMPYRQKISIVGRSEYSVPYSKLWNIEKYDLAINLRARSMFTEGRAERVYQYSTKFDAETNKLLAESLGENEDFSDFRVIQQ